MDLLLSGSREIALEVPVLYPAPGLKTFQKRLHTFPQDLDERTFLRVSSAIRLSSGRRKLGLHFHQLQEAVVGRELYALLEDSRLHPAGLEELVACLQHGKFPREIETLYAAGSRARIGSRLSFPALVRDGKRNYNLELPPFEMLFVKGAHVLCAIELS